MALMQMNTQLMETLKNKFGGIEILETIPEDYLLVIIVCKVPGLKALSPTVATMLLNKNADLVVSLQATRHSHDSEMSGYTVKS